MLTEAEVAELVALGPFFAIEIHRPSSAPRPPWRPIGELAGVFADRVVAVRESLAANNGLAPAGIELRVAASVAQLGLVARLVSSALAVAVLRGELLEVADAWWQPVGGSAFPLSLPANTRRPSQLAEEFGRQVLTGPVGALVEVSAACSVPARIRWGNVASALHGAAALVAAARPDLDVAGFLAAVLSLPPLADTHTWREGRFQRRSCCLIYRANAHRAGPVCGDCVLAR